MSERVPIVVVAGPTASGKTSLSLALAESLGGEIVNFDSVQLYCDFDLGTAKPTPAEMGRVPHHLIGVADAREPWTAGEYARRARPVIEAVAARGRLPVLVGGTGFYLRALLRGLSPLPPGDEELRARLRRRSQPRLHRLLQRLDPEAAARIAEGDASKAIRALEVRILTRRPLGDAWRSEAPQAWESVRPMVMVLAPDRAALYERIDRRAETMFAGGIQEETQRLLGVYGPECRIWTSHGYKQACDILLRGADPAAALAEAQFEQHHYAKRQGTWFRKEVGVHWLHGFGDDPAIQRQAIEWLAGRYGSMAI